MYLKDKIRIWVALGLVAIIALSYILSNSKDIAGYTAIACMLIWLAIMYFLRKQD